MPYRSEGLQRLDHRHTRARSEETALALQQQPWQAVRFTRGAYAFYRPGEWFSVRSPLRKRFGRVFFAGEHIADWQGFMEGAVQTGCDAAKEVLRASKSLRDIAQLHW